MLLPEERLIPADVERALRTVGITGQAAALLMIVFGVLIIAFPALIAWLVGLYLIIVGVLQLAGGMEAGRRRAP